MKTYADIKAEIAKLEKRAEDARKAEIAGVVGRIKEAISAYGLTAADLGLGRAASSRAKPVKAAKSTGRPAIGVARYRDPATGKTWTGQGRPPAWIVDATDRDAFRIGSANSAPSTRGRAKATRKARATPKRQAASKRGANGKKMRANRKTSAAPLKTAAVQIESSAASE